jgi:predicted DNA binding protein
VIVADFDHSTPLFASALAAAPAVSPTFDRMYATREPDGSGEIRVQFEVAADSGAPLDRFVRELDADPTVARTVALSDEGTERRYRVSLTDAGEAASTYPAVAAADAALVTGTATADGWTVRLRFPNRESVGRYRERCADRDAAPDLRRLHSDEASGEGDSELTDPQAAILRRAIELGYFDIPRSASLAEVGESLDITGQAASERLRRALKAHLSASLCRDRTLANQGSRSDLPAESGVDGPAGSDALTDPAG